jgi:hypothetical protein
MEFLVDRKKVIDYLVLPQLIAPHVPEEEPILFTLFGGKGDGSQKLKMKNLDARSFQ